MSFTESQRRGGLYVKPMEYATCDRCGITRPTAQTRNMPGPSGIQHVCSDVKSCDRFKKELKVKR